MCWLFPPPHYKSIPRMGSGTGRYHSRSRKPMSHLNIIPTFLKRRGVAECTRTVLGPKTEPKPGLSETVGLCSSAPRRRGALIESHRSVHYTHYQLSTRTGALECRSNAVLFIAEATLAQFAGRNKDIQAIDAPTYRGHTRLHIQGRPDATKKQDDHLTLCVNERRTNNTKTRQM